MSQRAFNRQINNSPMQMGKSSREPQLLGGIVGEYLNRCVGPKHLQWQALQQLWFELVDEDVAGHCELVDFTDGRLTVSVDSPGYAHELRLLGSDLIKQMRKRAPQLKIKRIKTVLG